MIRITSGTVKNKKIEIPAVENIRVAQDVVRQAIFTILGQNLTKATVLDLYAGSGVLGIEALSRGAKYVDFVDASWEATQSVEKNLKNCNFTNVFDEETNEVSIKYDVHLMNAGKFAQSIERKYDLIFADPFYEDLNHKHLITNLDKILKKNGHIVFLHSNKLAIDTLLEDTKLKINTQRKFGQTIITILSH